MKLKTLYIPFLLLILLFAQHQNGCAQTDAFAQLQLSNRQVYVQQPIKASVVLYTATWFTQPPEITNLQIAGAFVLPFSQTLSSMRTIDNKKYATLEYYYLIFPFESGELTVPSFAIEIETPPVGDYKGTPMTLTTKQATVNVLALPDNPLQNDWFVANNVTLSDTWDASLGNLKVGEMIERTITVRANGTLPAFIPELRLPAVDWAGMYPRKPQLKDTRTATAANGVRTEKIRFLLEKEGTFELPPVIVEWYNPYVGKAYSRTLAARTITVATNPNLELLTTMRDSLAMETPLQDASDKETSTQLFGLSWQQWIQLFVAALLVILLLRWLAPRIKRALIQRHKRYRNSERYHRKRVLSTANASVQTQLNALYAWQAATGNTLKNDSFEQLLGKYYQTSQTTGFTRRELKTILQQHPIKSDQQRRKGLNEV